MRGTFRRLECDIAGKALRHNDIDRTFADIVSLDKAVVIEMRKLPFPQDAAGLAHLLETLYFFDADVEKSDRGPFDVEQHSRQSATHGSEIDEMCLVRANRGANVEHH